LLVLLDRLGELAGLEELLSRRQVSRLLWLGILPQASESETQPCHGGDYERQDGLHGAFAEEPSNIARSPPD